ncbi:MAG: hypothetical protein JNK21_11520 [Rhodospirillaceae bacterium]|nr:hypothetical protein [Rhodospirillaceae bacterium]
MLALKVRKAFPFKEPDFAAFWSDTEASVYAWEKATVQEALNDAGLNYRAQVVPETFVRPQGKDGLRLVPMLDGFEGQFWKNGFPQVSRWWPAQPSAYEWANFARVCGMAPDAAEAAAESTSLEFLEKPWTEGELSFNDLSAVLQSRKVMAIAATAIACPFLMLGTEIAITSIAEGSVRQNIASLSQANQAIRRDRAAAYDNLDAIEEFIQVDAYPPQINVLARAMAIFAEAGSLRILSWSFDRGNLEIIARGGGQQIDPTTFITAFERDELFENVGGTLVGPERDLQLRLAVTTRQAANAAKVETAAKTESAAK